jgi:hypothetical protein
MEFVVAYGRYERRNLCDYVSDTVAGNGFIVWGSNDLNRWPYNFLHCLDHPWLLRHGLLREALMLVLPAGARCYA